MTHEEQIGHAENFFNLIFANIHEPRFSYVCTIDNKKFGKLYPFDVSTATNRRNMAQKAIELSDLGHNVYFAVNCSAEPPTDYQRGDSSKIVLQTATIADVDIAGGNHKSGTKKKLPKDFDDAKSFLPFKVSLLVHSGGGLHTYCIFDEPIKITADNRDDAVQRNKKFIEVIRSRAGEFKGGVDGVGDLARVLRVPGTQNFKGGVSADDAPFCHVVEFDDVRFSTDSIDAALDAEILSQESKTLEKTVAKLRDETKKSARTRFDSIFDSPEYNIFRAQIMLNALKNVNHDDLSYGRWLAINTACKNIGVPYADVDAFNACEPNNYNAEQNAKRWQKLNDSRFNIETLHGIARDLANYRESDARQEYRKLYPELFFKQGDEVFSSDDYQFYFGGDTSDLDFARRFEHAFGDKIRWLRDNERWLTFSNGVWTFGSDKNSCILPFAKKVGDAMIQHAVTNFEVKLANTTKSAAKLSAAVTMMKALDSILITSDDLDNHPELLNCSNGVVDLTNGKFYPSDSSLLLTQQVNAVYDANVTSELVDKFFKSIQPDEMTRRGLLRWLGYSLSGEVNEEKFMVWQGAGSNGKGVLSGTLLELFGSYGVGLTPTALLKNNRPADANAATTSLNSIEKARFAISEEMPADGELDVSLVKNLTGGDRINLRRNYGEYRTIKPTAKINLSGNYLPRIENVDDDGLLRRLLNMPFTVKFGTEENPRDETLKKKLLLPENLNALLSLLVRESVAWYRRDDGGLIISNAMKQETARLLNQSDFVSEFIDDFYVRAPNAFVKAKDFVDELKAAYPRETRRFKRADLIKLIERVGGVTYCEDRNRNRIFRGIGKLADSDFDGEPVNPSETAMP